jgi:hypothetical protein
MHGKRCCWSPGFLAAFVILVYAGGALTSDNKGSSGGGSSGGGNSGDDAAPVYYNHELCEERAVALGYARDSYEFQAAVSDCDQTELGETIPSR